KFVAKIFRNRADQKCRNLLLMELYYTEKKNIFAKHLKIVGSEAHHISKVMRHKSGDIIYVTDGEGNEYQVAITKIGSNNIEAEILTKNRKPREPICQITLAPSIIKGKHMDLIIEKTTELGVYNILPIITERTVASISEKKAERYQKIILSATKSSTRTYLPTLLKPIKFDDLLKTTNNYDIAILAYEDEDTHNRLADILKSDFLQKVLLIIGPEGGFTANEIQLAKAHNVQCFSLGPRRLRAETAAITALSLLLYELKEI
ncbi:MAG: 16S rRNA (uracil(1498)-N(3))-methyltransferase, partial [candidate division WOR-3 bacterium]|nr:16S rRNA (uracil(1498)-N(3))-methyltransferase [candidate division WOR-3 bacterium]